MTNRRRRSQNYWKLLLACMLAIGSALSSHATKDARSESPTVQLSEAHQSPHASHASTPDHR